VVWATGVSVFGMALAGTVWIIPMVKAAKMSAAANASLLLFI
jgi:hypothetical protein